MVDCSTKPSIIRLVMPNGRYATVQEYMEMTETTSAQLLERVNERLRGAQKMSRSMFSYILRGSRRCSGEKAWAIHLETGVPMEELTRWPRSTEPDNSGSDGKGSHV